MKQTVIERAAQALGERFVSVWVLLSQTTDFLGRTSVFYQYEARLRQINSILRSSRGSEETVREIREELIQIRRGLRLSGYDLTLGKQELTLQGFRNDAALAEGFQRAVLFIEEKHLWCITGSGNHIELHGQLENSLRGRGAVTIQQKHYIWYRWDRDLLVVSGAATETADDWEAFKAWCMIKENKLALIGRIKRMR